MKSALITGIALLLLGVGSLFLPPYRYTVKEEVIKFGPFQASAEKQKEIEVPPAVSWIFVVGGVALTAFGVIRRR